MQTKNHHSYTSPHKYTIVDSAGVDLCADAQVPYYGTREEAAQEMDAIAHNCCDIPLPLRIVQLS